MHHWDQWTDLSNFLGNDANQLDKTTAAQLAVTPTAVTFCHFFHLGWMIFFRKMEPFQCWYKDIVMEGFFKKAFNLSWIFFQSFLHQFLIEMLTAIGIAVHYGNHGPYTHRNYSREKEAVSEFKSIIWIYPSKINEHP